LPRNLSVLDVSWGSGLQMPVTITFVQRRIRGVAPY
jgi:hypothetical protein